MEFKYFEPSTDVIVAIKDENKTALVAILVGIINRDPTFETELYVEAYKYISDQLGETLKEDKKNIPGEYILDKDEWSKDYFRMLLVWLSDNFCDERIDYIKRVGQHVYRNEMTFGKSDAANFTSPVTQMEKEKTVSVTGTIILILILIVVVGAAIIYWKMSH